ncbi:hypothetical protein CLV30_104278 [Haloactinopolyspora alba]|uniref:Uncharacterized protein n=1 Tax=Haloactinopolyspora alba TaxID=648780 RepID=A0A2P8E7L2_9ACTN|nr:hypothetical protein [Haloactinopolyspora alba]PSL05408.1 hypothetical protein CLV30_104278 [Haloactinopolyspora alba]
MSGHNDEFRSDPLDLGTVTHSGDDPHTAAPDEPDAPVAPDSDPHRRRRRVAIGAALAAGVVAGVLVNAATSDDRGELFALASFSYTSAPPAGAANVTVDVYNAGPEQVELLDLRVPGYELLGGTAPDDAVTAAPRSWATVELSMRRDCAVEPSGTIEARVRSGGDTSTREVAVQGATGGPLSGADECDRSAVEFGQATTTRHDDHLRTMVPVTNPIDEEVLVEEVSSATLGFTADAAPVTVPAEGRRQLEIVWRVGDCDGTRELAAAEIEYEFDDAQGERSTLVVHPFDAALLAELARLAERVCET